MPELHLSFSLSPVIALLLSVAAVGISLWAYRATVPPVPRAVRWLLTFLRSAAFLCLILIIAKPILTVRRVVVERPIVLLMVDNSQSMSIRDRTGQRSASVRQMIESPAFSKLRSSVDVQTLRFDRVTRALSAPSADSMSFDGAVTNIADAFRAAKTRTETSNLCAAVLISDGNSTEGTNPVYDAVALGTPVFTVGIGDSLEQNDLILQRVAANTVAYAKTRVPFRVSIRNKGFNGQSVKIVLREGNKLLDSATVLLSGNAEEQHATLFAIPEAEGRHTYTAEAAPLKGEFTQANNRAEASVNVLRSKMNVVLIAGGPNPDAAFIRRVIEADENVALRAFTETPGGGFVEGSVPGEILGAADAIALIGYPRAESDPALLQQIRTAAEAGTGLFVVFSRTTDVSGLTRLAPVLPVSVANVQASELQVFAEIPDARIEHAILKSASGATAQELWSKLPPVFRWQSGIAAKPEADVLAYVRFGATVLTEPLIAARNINGQRSAVVTGYSLWRWQMYGDAAAGTDRLWPAFISNTMRWLTTHDDDRRIRVRPVRQSWTTAEPVEFQGQVYDESYRPVNDATIVVTLANAEQTRTINLDLDENGQYAGATDPLAEGVYAYTSVITVNGTSSEGERGTLRVGPTAVEFLETAMNKPLLQQIASRTGGVYFESSDMNGLTAAITALPNLASKERTQTDETELWNVWWMMAAAIGCIAAEWTIRKRMGMV